MTEHDQSQQSTIAQVSTAAVDTTKTVAQEVVAVPQKTEKRLAKFFRTLGPGLITGASDDDPSGIATYSQTGAQFGFAHLWLSLFTFPLMSSVQEMCGRIGLVTGDGLAGVIRKNYAKPVLYFAVLLLFIANSINVGADLGAMASATQLLMPQVTLPVLGTLDTGSTFTIFLLLFVLVSLVLQILLPYKTYANFLKFLTLSLFAYFVIPFIVTADWLAILRHTVVPTLALNKEVLMNVVAILGTTISPYLFFWQTNEEVEEQISDGLTTLKSRQGTTKRALQNMRTDVLSGMFFSNIVMWFIIVTTAATLATHGITNIDSAPQAAEALRPIAGNFAYLLFALGIIGTGMLAVPILSGSAAYAFSEAIGWREGLNLKFKQARAFYCVIITSVLVGVITNFIGIDPIKMLYYTAIINGIVAPPLLFLILKICNNKNIMGTRTNRRLSNTLGYITFVAMSLAALLLLLSFLPIFQ